MTASNWSASLTSLITGRSPVMGASCLFLRIGHHPNGERVSSTNAPCRSGARPSLTAELERAVRERSPVRRLSSVLLGWRCLRNGVRVQTFSSAPHARQRPSCDGQPRTTTRRCRSSADSATCGGASPRVVTRSGLELPDWSAEVMARFADWAKRKGNQSGLGGHPPCNSLDGTAARMTTTPQCNLRCLSTRRRVVSARAGRSHARLRAQEPPRPSAGQPTRDPPARRCQRTARDRPPRAGDGSDGAPLWPSRR